MRMEHWGETPYLVDPPRVVQAVLLTYYFR